MSSARSPLPRFALRCAALAVLAAAVANVGCQPSAVSSAPPKLGDQPLPTIEAELVTVGPQNWPTIVRCQGSLVADEVAVVGARVAGRVEQVDVDLGDVVEKNVPLAELEQTDFELQIAQAEAQLTQARSAVGLKADEPVASLEPEDAPPVREVAALWEEAKANLRRAEKLRQQNAITQAEFDQFAAAEGVAAAQHSSAINSVREKMAIIGVRQAELSLARQRLADAVVHAPFAGRIQQRHVAPGTYVQVGDPIVTLVRVNPLRFRGNIPERHAQRLQEGQRLELHIESLGAPLIVKVTRISPALDQRSRSLLFEANVANDQQTLRTGLFAEADVVLDAESTALVVPHSAVVEFAGAEKVWKVVDGVAGEHEVLTGGRREAGIVILQGLEVGDVILIDGDQGRVAKIAAPTDSEPIADTPEPASPPAAADETPPDPIPAATSG